MDKLSNIQLYQIFQDCKPNRFAKEPDFNNVIDSVSSKLSIVTTEKLCSDVN